MPKRPSDLASIGPIYAELMEEIKRRVEVVGHVYNGTVRLPPMAGFELCYVQLRKICEVFALACLTAHVDPITSGFLTKDELLKLYGECGNFLHRGSIRQLLSKWEPTLDFQRINNWVGKIVALLNHHQIQTSQPDKQLWVLMHGEDGKVHWHVMVVVAKLGKQT
jgi:hypothetical protein